MKAKLALILAVVLLPNIMAHAAELRGRVTAADTGASLVGAAITLTPIEGGAAISDTTDLFGRYELVALPVGDYTLGASQAGYVPFSEPRSYAADEIAATDIALDPVLDGGGGGGDGPHRIDVQVQVFDTSTMVPLRTVPVRIRRYDLDEPTTLEETTVGLTNADGEFSLRSQKKGWYDFRLNNADDDSPRPYYKSQDRPTKLRFEKTHSVVAQLLPIGQEVKVVVTGPNPATPEAGPVPLRDVYLELIGIDPGYTPHLGFDPMTERLSDFAIPVFQKIVGKTDHLGEFTFQNLPPVGFIVVAKKPGYHATESLMKPTPSGDLPEIFPVSIGLNPRTKVEVILVSPYTTPAMSMGLGVKLEGLAATSTDGLDRTAPALPVPPSDEFPFGAVRAEFDFLLPGRYRASLEGAVHSPPTPASESVVSSVAIRYQGEEYFHAAEGIMNTRHIDLNPVPATVRGRLFVAEERRRLDLPASEAPIPFDRWEGPAYKLAEREGIIFKESALGDYLPTGSDMAITGSASDGTFGLNLMPGFYGVTIPPLDGYWGSNFRARNLSTGESFALGWPYAVDPAAVGGIPVHPFGSLGIPISSGDEWEIDLFVRKQTYILDGTVLGDTDALALDRIISDPETDPFLIADHNDLAGLGSVSFEVNMAAPPAAVGFPLELGTSPDGLGDRVTNINGVFHIPAPPGTHTLTLSHPHYLFPDGVFEIVSLPDYGFVGEGGSGDGIIPMENNWGQLAAAQGTVDPFTSDYTGEHDLLIRLFDEDDGGMPVLGRSETRPDIFTHPGHGGKLFASSPLGSFSMTTGAYTIWIKDGTTWFEESFTIEAASPSTIVIDFNRVASLPGGIGPIGMPPAQSFDLNIEAINVDDPTHKLKDFSLVMDDGATLATTVGGSIIAMSSYSGSYVPDRLLATESGSTWLPLSGNFTEPSYEIDLDVLGVVPKVNVTLTLRRGSRIMGDVMATKTIGATTHRVPLDAAEVQVRDRFGSLLMTLTTDAEGHFETSTALERTSTVFIEINEPGFLPYRGRFSAASATGSGAGGELDFDLGMIALASRPQPTFVDKVESLDRRGMFLVGVRAGKNAVGSFDLADSDTIMGYTVTADTPFLELVDLPEFDDADGSSAGTVQVEIKDRVKQVWIVDPRSFTGNPTLSMAEAYLPPSETITEEGPDLGKPDPLFPRTMRAWLRALGGTGGQMPIMPKTNVFHVRDTMVSSSMPMGPDGEEFVRATAVGPIDLASLPPGLFEPYIVAETESGSFAYFQWNGTTFDPVLPEYLRLYGMRLPPDLNRFADMIGTVSAVQSGIGGIDVQLQRSYPDGFITIEPDITGDITLNDGSEPGEADDATLRYHYDLGVTFASGAGMPGTGWLAMGPGYAGLKVRGSYGIDVNGSRSGIADARGVPVIERRGTVFGTFEEKDAEGYFPSASTVKDTPGVGLPKLPPSVVSFSPTATVGGTYKRIDLLDFDDMGELKKLHELIETQLFGEIGLNMRFDATRILARIPALAPTLTPLRETGALVATVLVKPSVGGKFTHLYSSHDQSEITPPSPKGSFSLVPTAEGMKDDRVLAPRLHVFGEDFRNTPQNQLTTSLLYGMTLGIDISLARGTLGANATFGTNLPEVPGSSTLEFQLNPNGDRPYIKRVRGAVAGNLTVSLDAWIAKIKRTWTWASIPINTPFNTEEQFFVIPVDIGEDILTLATAPATTWTGGTGPQRVLDYFPVARHAGATASDGTQGLLYLDPDPAGGGMKLKVAFGSPDWGEPVEIASAAAIVGVALAETADGGWLAVWSEFAAEDVGLLSPPSTLKFASSSDGLSWSTPATIGATAGTAFDLRLLPMPGGDLGLVSFESERGPQSEVIDIAGYLFSEEAWGARQLLFDEITLTGWDAAGPGFDGTEAAQIVGVTDTGGLVVAGWNGADVVPPLSLDGALSGDYLALVSGPDDFFLAAAPLAGGGIGLFSKTGATAWAALPSILPEVGALEIAVAPIAPGETTHYLVAWTDRGGALGFAYLDAAGTLLSGPTPIPVSSGRYSQLRASAGDLIAVSENGDRTELRVFSTSEDGGLIPTDGDTDLLDDLVELRIIDADPDDAITTLAEVLGTDDFDGDGFSNAAEIAVGTDPIDPARFPGQIVTITPAVPEAQEFGSSPAVVTIERRGDPSSVLTVFYSVAGDAVPDVDYAALPGSVTLAAGITRAFLGITPVEDTLPEGNETVVVSLTPDATYAIGAPDVATVSIVDPPLDEWRFTRFTAEELADPALSGLLADGDSDGLNVLLEYAFDSDPNLSATDELPLVTALENGATGSRHSALVFLRRINDPEIAYVPQISSDLATWSNATDSDIETLSTTDNGDGTETVVIRDRTPIDGLVRRFVRLSIVRIAP